MKPEDLINYIGAEYRKLDENGKAYGCMMPVYMLYPEIPRYDWPEEGKGFPEKVLELLKTHGKPVRLQDIRPGDVIAIRALFNFLHIGVYVGDDQVVHTSPDNGMESFRLSMVIRSVKGVYRWRT